MAAGVDGPKSDAACRPWAVAGAALSIAAAVSLRAAELPWWRDAPALAALTAGLTATAVATWRRHRRRARALHGRPAFFQAIARMQDDAADGWGMLVQEKVVDGFALWDADDRLVACSGFLAHYLPKLAEWRGPTGSQVIAAMVDAGVLAMEGVDDPHNTIDILCQLRRQVPGLRAFRMADGKVFMARTIDIGQGRRITTFVDITELRTQQNARKVHEDVFRAAFDSAPAMLVLLDAENRPQAVNQAFRSALGYSVERLNELGWAGIVHPDDAGESGKGSWIPGSRRFLAANGSVIRCQVRVAGVREDGLAQHTLAIIEDVTARWEADQRTRFLAGLPEHIDDAVLAVDAEGRITYGNSSARTLFQWGESELPGAPVEHLLGEAARDALRDGRGAVETHGTTWNGSHFPAEVGIGRLHGGGAVLVVTDLTPRRALDLQLMHSARLATLGEMAASIAHEFNQCLHVIRLASEALRLDLRDGAPDPGRIAKRTDNILTQVDRLTEMVSHMRSVSRKDVADKRPFPVEGAVGSALRMVEPLLAADGIRLVREGTLEQVLALGHQVRLEQVLLNLLNNARDSIRERTRRDRGKGGTITVASALDEKGRIRIAVADDGTGVPDDAARHIFEAFFTTKAGERGSGLGLSISRGICGEMGGSLSFRNLDRGAEFVIELPCAPANPVLPASAPSPAAPPVPDAELERAEDEDEEDAIDERRLLLVDDEALSVMMMSEYLERQGYAVDVAYDGVEALAKCETHVYHAVVTDIRMPRMDGRELIARLDDLQPGTPVIVVSGHLKDDQDRELGANVVALLSKPFQLHDLREQLRRLDEPLAGIKANRQEEDA